jgi:hypothetical protein
MKQTRHNSAQGNHVFTEEEEGHVRLQQLDGAEEPTKTFEEPDHQKRRESKFPNEFKQPEEAQEIEDIVHQNLSVPQRDDPPKGSVRNDIITVCSVTIWATAQIVILSSFVTVFPFSTPS